MIGLADTLFIAALRRFATRARELVEGFPFVAEEWLLVGVAGVGYLEAVVVALAIAVRGPLVAPEGDLRKAVMAYSALATFVLTVAALLPLARLGRRQRSFLRGTLVGCVLYSYGFEVTQHARGLDPRMSEFWTLIDNALSNVYFLTSQGYVVVSALLAWAFLRRSTQGAEGLVVLAVRYALLTTAIAFLVGYVMLSDGRGHVEGRGTWLAIHAQGSHGLQAIPLVAWLLGKTPLPAQLRRKLVHVGGLAWLLGGVAIFCQTAEGRSLLELSLASALFVVLMATYLAVFLLALAWRKMKQRPVALQVAPTLLSFVLCAQSLVVAVCVVLTVRHTWSRRNSPLTALPAPHQTAPRAQLASLKVHGLEFVRLPSGSFVMGCASGDTQCDRDEKPRQVVQINSFYLARTETPVWAWRQCETQGACRPRRSPDLRCRYINQSDEYPVVCVDYADAEAFCKWLGGRVPRAAEWEYAAKSGDDDAYPWGNAPISHDRARYGVLSGIAPVDSNHAGDTPWGLTNMAGNVLEWTATDYSPRFKEHRGGGWSQRARWMRASNRSGRSPDSNGVSLGIRCARDEAPLFSTSLAK